MNNPKLRKSILAAAISLALASTNSQAKPKLTDIQGLPETLSVSTIRTSKDNSGNVIATWGDSGTLYLDKIPTNGTPPTPTILADNILDQALATLDSVYFSLWSSNTAPPFPVQGLQSGEPAISLDFGSTELDYLKVLPRNPGGFAAVVGETATLIDELGQPEGDPLDLGGFTDVALDNAGDFILLSNGDVDGLVLRKYPDGQPHTVVPLAGAVSTYDFESEGHNANRRVGLEISDSKVVVNSNGEILISWQEALYKDQRRFVRKNCHTYEGERYCDDEYYVYSGTSTKTLVVQRFNNNLTPKDPKPLAVVSVKGKYPSKQTGYLGEYAVALDSQGDFDVAYSVGKHTDAQSEYETSGIDSDVFVRQFVNNNKGKLVSGKAMKLSGTPKTAHPSEKGKIKYSSNNEPSVVITNDANNEFMVIWHNDFEDHYKDAENMERVCTKYKTVKDEYGESYKYCPESNYKEVPSDAMDERSILKAKRYGN